MNKESSKVFAGHTETSRGAAQVARRRVGRVEQLVLRAFADAGKDGLTDAELAQTTALPDNSARPRRVALARRGVLLYFGHKRLTPNNVLARVWVLAQAAAGEEHRP